MEKQSAAEVEAKGTAASSASAEIPETQANPSPSTTAAATQDTDANTATASTNDDPPLSKNQLKKRRRWEKSQAIKKRRKEQARELKRLKAKKEGRDLDAEREQQLQNEKEGTGWKKREDKWKEITQRADIDNSFRVCFDCSFEDQMTWKEMNSLGLQLRYTYATNRKSTMPVYIDVCGLKKGGQTRGHLEKVEGFPDRWVGRAFHCYEENMEEVYGKCVRDVADSGTGASCENKAVDGSKCTTASEDKVESQDSEEKDDNKASVNSGKDPAKSASSKATISEETATAGTNNDDKKQGNATNKESGQQPYPKLRPDHKFVYLTGDSPNTLNTLDNNTTYIIGGIVDRNRLKRAAIDRAEAINAKNIPSLNIQTARLPLDEHLDFKASTRILTCNHVFEILQRFRENGYKDWGGAVLAVMPDRKDIEEKKDDGKD